MVRFGQSVYVKILICAAIAQLGERQTEDLKVLCSIHGGGIFFPFFIYNNNY